LRLVLLQEMTSSRRRAASATNSIEISRRSTSKHGRTTGGQSLTPVLRPGLPGLRQLRAGTREAELVEEVSRRQGQIDLQGVLGGVDLRQAGERRHLDVAGIELLLGQRDGAPSDASQVAWVAPCLRLPFQGKRDKVPDV